MEFTGRQLIIGVYLYSKGDFDKCYEVIKNKIMLNDYVEKHIKKIKAIEPYVITLVDWDYPIKLKHIKRPPFVILKGTKALLENDLD